MPIKVPQYGLLPTHSPVYCCHCMLHCCLKVIAIIWLHDTIVLPSNSYFDMWLQFHICLPPGCIYICRSCPKVKQWQTAATIPYKLQWTQKKKKLQYLKSRGCFVGQHQSKIYMFDTALLMILKNLLCLNLPISWCTFAKQNFPHFNYILNIRLGVVFQLIKFTGVGLWKSDIQLNFIWNNSKTQKAIE